MKCCATKWYVCVTFILAASLLAANARAADRLTVDKEAKLGHESIEMFKAIESGDVEVTLIPKDATEATVIFTNKSKRPLAVALPEAFVGVPVLPQFGGMGMGGFGGGMMGGGMMGGGQGFGGGFGGGMMGGGMGMGGGFGGMGGFMNVEPDTTRKVKVKGVCLEHGKEDPSPRMKYAIKPIESFTDKAGVYEVCKMLARGEISQNVAQAAAWHVMDDMSWKELAAKNRIESKLSNYRERFFSNQELFLADRTVRVAGERAEKLAASLQAVRETDSQNAVSQQ
jgi:hypothetical protein